MSICAVVSYCFFFFFKQKTAYEMRISDWSSDVCSSDLSFNAVRNTSLGGTYAYSNYGHGVDASTGSFVAINPNINADASRLMSTGSTAFPARWTNETVALTKAPTFPSPVPTRHPAGIATPAPPSAAHPPNPHPQPATPL